MMKIINTTGKIALLLCTTFCFLQCSDEVDEGSGSGGEIIITDSLPMGTFEQKVSNVTAIAALRSLTISWNAPEDISDLAYYLVEWKGTATDATLYSKPSNTTSLKIEKLYNDVYTIGVRAVSNDMLKSEVVNAATTYEPIPDNNAPGFISELKVSAVVGSASLIWTNPIDEDFEYTIVRYKGVDLTDWVYVDTLSSITTSWNIYGLTELTNYEYVIETSDYIGNKSEKLEGQFKTKTEQPLEKFNDEGDPLWNIFYWSSRTQDAHAEEMLDDDLDTKWHSAWTSGNEFSDGFTSTGLPQYFILDLEKEVIPSAVILYPWDTRGPNLVRIEAAMEEPNNNTEWIDLGTSVLDGSKAKQPLTCGLNKVVTAKYLKITILQANNVGSAIIGSVEVNVLVDQ